MKEKILKSVKIIARIISILFLLMFLVFFIGEGVINNISSLKVQDILLLLLIPGALTVGTVVAWKKELLGGIIICSVFIVFNITGYIISQKITSPNFLIIFIVGILFIIVGVNSKKTSKQTKN